MSMPVSPVVVIHGGAGMYAKIEQDGVPRADVDEAMRDAALAGYAALQAGGSAVDAVTAAVASMEDSPTCNAGYGSCLTVDGEVEMDAAVMDGSSLRLGGVGAITNVKNPIEVARVVMDKSPHVLFCGHGANKFAEDHGFEKIPTEDLVCDHTRARLKKIPDFAPSVTSEFKASSSVAHPFKSESDHDTVGAVCLDKDGNLAYATSTGGINAKYPGRVGDSPVGGCGGYAENGLAACSTTGTGEALVKSCLGWRICSYMEQGLDVHEASKKGLQALQTKFNGSGGDIVVDSKGEIGIHFTTPGMGWAYTKDNTLCWGIYHGENFSKAIKQ